MTLAPCTANGKILGESFSGQARLMAENEYAPIQSAFSKKYGLMIRVFNLLGRLRKARRVFVEIIPNTN